MNSDKEAIFRRIREALAHEAPRPGGHESSGPTPAERDFRKALPAVGATLLERVECFRAKSAELKTDFYFESSMESALNRLVEIKEREQWRRVASHHTELTAAACARLEAPLCWTDPNYSANELEQCDAAVTGCDALIAQTGSVLVSSRSAGGRALSVLPPHHVVLAARDQMVADLPEAFALLKTKYGGGFPSLISFITGPSRTGDIERILVLGAHGPKKLTVLCF